jgi:hypothetical protein
MKKITKTIDKGQYLSDILTSLPTNTIIFKTATGIGATHLEISCLRNSIIIEPNVPVIKGKRAKGILGIYEGVDVSIIMDYLSNDSILYKKILVTPESFKKVIDAAENLNIDLYTDYFLLYDECDRTMKDVSYRSTIIAPMEHFFLFNQKAYISATAVIPSDPRFGEHRFKQLIIKPTYDYQQELELIVTNNVPDSTRSLIENLQSDCICIFYNSIQGITRLIRDLGIEEESNVYCSTNKAAELNINGLNRTYENLTPTFAKYNFFTSRYNAAVDINMDTKPVVIIITNLHVAHHTMVDPNSDAIQIVGRFRNGVEEVIAISNVDDTIKAKTPAESLSYLEGCAESYNLLNTLKNAATNDGARDTLEEALKLVTYSSFLNDDGSKNHFMFDNFLYEETVKVLYSDAVTLFESYKNEHFAPIFKLENYLLSDTDLTSTVIGLTIRNLTKELISTLNIIEKEDEYLYVLDNKQIVRDKLEQMFPDIVKAYYLLGPSELLANSYSKKQMLQAMGLKREETDKSNFEFIRSLQNEFPDGYEATTKKLTDKLTTVIEKHNLSLQSTIPLLSEYFDLSPRKTLKGRGSKGYKIIKSHFNKRDNN